MRLNIWLLFCSFSWTINLFSDDITCNFSCKWNTLAHAARSEWYLCEENDFEIAFRRDASTTGIAQVDLPDHKVFIYCTPRVNLLYLWHFSTLMPRAVLHLKYILRSLVFSFFLLLFPVLFAIHHLKQTHKNTQLNKRIKKK